MAETLEPIIKKHPFFKDLDQKYLDLIVGCASNVRFKEGDLIMKENDPANKFYIVREGMVAIDIPTGSSDTVTVQTVGAGDIIGWSWLIPPHHYKFNCRAVKDIRAIAFDGRCLRGKCEQDTGLGYELMKRLAAIFTQRLEAARKQILSLSS